MDEQRSGQKKRQPGPGTAKQERYLQPSILLSLKQSPSYGYEIIGALQRFGFIQGAAPPGMIYRHLRQLEGDGLVTSHWETQGTGPAKRIYEITSEGDEALELWIAHMALLRDKLTAFIESYQASAR
ncbi:MAG: helix-turn-helix transcriptional regulator [Desulfosarcinaceae bacterium]|nr:helix-turn-helix transcriptional regulator [Desulfosarcinaceae bacterium]